MRIRQKHGPVGQWSFEDRRRRWPRPNRPALDDLLELLAQAAEILEQQELLFPTRLAFHGWIEEPGEPPLAERSTMVPLGRAAEIRAAGSAVLDRLEADRGFRAVSSANILGWGIGLHAGGAPRRIPNLLWLNGGTLGFHLINVNTQSDIWLPYSLKAEPQTELSRLNAPRLEAGLRSLEEHLPVVAIPGDPTPFAIPSGRGLLSHIGHDGKIADVIWDDDLIEPEEEA